MKVIIEGFVFMTEIKILDIGKGFEFTDRDVKLWKLTIDVKIKRTIDN